MSDPIMKEYIEEATLFVFGYTLNQIMIKCREKIFVVPRQAYFTARSKYTKCTLKELCEEMFDDYGFVIDHATIIHCKHVVDDVFLPGNVVTKADKEFARRVQRFMALVEAKYKELYPPKQSIRRNPWSDKNIFIVTDGFPGL